MTRLPQWRQLLVLLTCMGLALLLGFHFGRLQEAEIRQQPRQNEALTQNEPLTKNEPSRQGEFSTEIRKYPKVKLTRKDYKATLMQREEIDTIIQYLPRNGTYIEWGTGGSTLLFTRFVKRAYSIEHVVEWCDRMTLRLRKQKQFNVAYHCVRAPKPGGGFYTNQFEGSYLTFRDYVDVVDKLRVPKFDFALIDGRARVAVSLKLLPYLNDNSVVALHDTATRATNQYKEVFNHYDQIEFVRATGQQGVTFFKRKEKYRGGANLPISEEFLKKV